MDLEVDALAIQLAERIDVHSMDALALRLYRARVGAVTLVSDQTLRNFIRVASESVGSHKFTLPFLLAIGTMHLARGWSSARS